LRCWLPTLFSGIRQSYKTKNNVAARQRREAILAALLDELGDAFKITDGQRFDIAYSDDCLDALVCALVACAAAKNRTVPPETPEHHHLARIEGWIHLPQPGSLRHLTSL
jgi:predicted RNase H-like nuclease